MVYLYDAIGALKVAKRAKGIGQPMEPVEETTITVRANGSYRVNGRVKVVDHEGNVLFEGTNVALCRCGHSESKPFCDSSHRRVGFQSVVCGEPMPAEIGTESRPS